MLARPTKPREGASIMQSFSPAVLCTTLVPEIEEGTEALPAVRGYTLLKKLGQGGMASIYLARQDLLDRAVSIKIMDGVGVDDVSRRRFENEACTIARLSHPGIVGIYEVGHTADGRLFYSMPFLPNGDLHQHIELTGKELRIVEVLRNLLHSLDYAHARGIVHRDVKPGNVLFDADNRPLLADFGIAMTRRSTDRRITSAGMVVGSAAYMAPEQAQGQVVDGRADLYSVGVLAYELLTGQLPYRSDDPLALALMHAQWDIPRLPSAHWHWQAFIDRAMAKSPEQRFQNAQEMLRALRRIGDRSGPHLQQRALRTLDRTAPGEGWRRPRLLALFALFLLVSVAYSERSRLPRFGAAEIPVAPAVARKHVQTFEAADAVRLPAAAPATEAPVAAAPAPAAPVATSPTPAPEQGDAARATPRRAHHHTARTVAREHGRAKPPAQAAPQLPAAAPAGQAGARHGLFGRIWQHIRHPIASSRGGTRDQ